MREALIAYLQAQQPQHLPRLRHEVQAAGRPAADEPPPMATPLPDGAAAMKAAGQATP